MPREHPGSISPADSYGCRPASLGGAKRVFGELMRSGDEPVPHLTGRIKSAFRRKRRKDASFELFGQGIPRD